MLHCVVSLIQQLMKGSVLVKSGFLEHLLSKTGLSERVFFCTFAGAKEGQMIIYQRSAGAKFPFGTRVS